MPSRWFHILTLALLVTACGSDDKNTDKTPDSSTQADAGKPAEDSGKGAVDAGEKPARDCDKAATPGNDCADAVGCRDTLECGLDTSSCCVPGFDVANVKCIDDTKCAMGVGRANCDGPEDCGGKACCVDIVKGTVNCLDGCGAQSALCHTDADCESPKVCKPGGSFTWWGVCG